MGVPQLLTRQNLSFLNSVYRPASPMFRVNFPILCKQNDMPCLGITARLQMEAHFAKKDKFLHFSLITTWTCLIGSFPAQSKSFYTFHIEKKKLLFDRIRVRTRDAIQTFDQNWISLNWVITFQSFLHTVLETESVAQYWCTRSILCKSIASVN